MSRPPRAPGLDLENGRFVTDVSQADVYMRGTDTQAWLVGPQGVALLLRPPQRSRQPTPGPSRMVADHEDSGGEEVEHGS
jgi:hypothetical protein